MSNIESQKQRLISELVDYGHFKDRKILSAFMRVKREDFVTENMKEYAYSNEPLPLMKGQTISQPLTVVAMLEALDVKEGMKVLEVGAGSGYNAALLSVLVGKGKVITTERIKELYEFAKKNLKNYENVEVIYSDGAHGYKKHSPYDRIIVTASATAIPKELLEQLKDGGRMVIPVGDEMLVIKKYKDKIEKEFIGYYAFVPLIKGIE